MGASEHLDEIFNLGDAGNHGRLGALAGRVPHNARWGLVGDGLLELDDLTGDVPANEAMVLALVARVDGTEKGGDGFPANLLDLLEADFHGIGGGDGRLGGFLSGGLVFA